MKQATREVLAVCCPSCRHPGFWQTRALTGRPKFVCDRCRRWWTCGEDGGPYQALAMNLKAPAPAWLKAFDDWELK